ncbi:hypothetical protein [Tardiphaga sp. P9-11]|uniref:hypothetical protein n=1 Tax=Tardiphaga sp. P9-11 TaxID=2024614 RepID=UPI001562BBC5|nr:hypothetical protein [Tardiphaga sp. P9-11]
MNDLSVIFTERGDLAHVAFRRNLKTASGLVQLVARNRQVQLRRALLTILLAKLGLAPLKGVHLFVRFLL